MSEKILHKKSLENPLLPEEIETKQKILEKDKKEKIIKGKNKSYVISKTIGKGTFGKVKLAYNVENRKEKYACKILLKSNIKDEDDKIRCEREMDILRKMHHVNVVRTYEIISTDKTYYIFMDYCSKGELFNYIVEKQHLSEGKSAFFYYQLINGIEYIHKKGVSHRDLKPENLLLTEKNKLKIIDFGLSNYFKGNLLETPCGSPCYASPEMIMGKKYNGFCTDIWSSGIILYAMLCGYLPFEEKENDEYNEVLFTNILRCKVEYPNEYITPVAKDLLLKILIKDPKKRITIEEIKSHNFYLLGELLYKQTFEKKGNNNDYLFIIDDDNDEKYIDLDEENAEKILENNKRDNNEKEEDNDKYIDIKDYNVDKNNENNNSIGLLIKKSINNSSKINKNKQIKNVENNKEKNKHNLDELNQIIPENNYVDKSENIKKKEVNKIHKKNKISQKQYLNKLNEEEKKQKKEFLIQNDNTNKLSLNNVEKDNKEYIYQNSTNIKIKSYKDKKSPKEYSLQTEYNNYNQSSNINLNTKDNNLNKQYLKTEVYPLNSKNKTKKSNNQYKLINKKIVNINKLTFENILKSLHNINILKIKTPKRFSTKKNINNKKNIIQSNSMNRKTLSSYSPINKKLSKNEKSFIIERINYPKNNYFPLNTYSSINNSHNFLKENILKYFSSKFVYDNKKFMFKNFKPNKKFLIKKNYKNKANNNINIFNNENYLILNKLAKNKNIKRKNLLKYSMNKALNIKSLEYYFSSKCSKKKYSIINEKANNDISKNSIYNINTIKNQKINISKNSFSNLKGNNNLYYIVPENSKSIIIKSNNIHKNTEKIKSKNIINTIYKNSNKFNLNTKLKSKNKNIKTKLHNLLINKVNNFYNKNNIDNNITINFNFLKSNIILDQNKTSLRKIKKNKIVLNIYNNFISPKSEKSTLNNNICPTFRSNYFNKYNNNNKNIDINQIKKNKENNKIIKNIH